MTRFISPYASQPIYHVGVVHFGHPCAGCGYGADPLQETPLQDTSSNGECRGQDGVECVERNGYSMCLTGLADLYASTVTFFAASTIVHETMHNFGEGVDIDHYGTRGAPTP